MSNQTQLASFLVVVFDRTARTFSVEGPIRDERACREAIAKLSKGGADVGYIPCFDGAARQWRRSAAESFRQVSHFRRVGIGSILGSDLRTLK